MKCLVKISVILFAVPMAHLRAEFTEMLTPAYYNDTAVQQEVDALRAACQKHPMHHPLKKPDGSTAEYTTPGMGDFGAGKGPTRKEQHHPAIDMHVGNRETDVGIYAAHDGIVTTVREDPKRKYRHYIAVTKMITDQDGKELGKLTTIYGHVDLDIDEADGLLLNGRTIKMGDLISRHLFDGTVGGPHLHFEIRYYRPLDKGIEEFYGITQKVPGAGPWPWGKWDPDVGFGYGHPWNYLKQRS